MENLLNEGKMVVLEVHTEYVLSKDVVKLCRDMRGLLAPIFKKAMKMTSFDSSRTVRKKFCCGKVMRVIEFWGWKARVWKAFLDGDDVLP